MFLDRGRRAARGRFTALKVQLFFAGAAVLLAGMVLGRDALVLLAIAILAAGFLLRFLDRPSEPETNLEDDPDGAEDDPPAGAETHPQE